MNQLNNDINMINDNNEIVTEWSYAQNAIGKMEALNVTPKPRNYSIWYNYFAKININLAEEIDHRLQKNLPFDEVFLRFLEKSHLENNIIKADNSEEVEHTQDVLSDALSIITSIISEASSQNQSIQSKLDDLINNKEKRDISSVLEAMVTIATEMKKSAVGLKSKLDESRNDVEVLEHRLSEISLEAEKDFLTGVYNRKALDKHFTRLISEAKISNEPLSLLAIDIDHFKRFNDQYGHLIGDEVLKTTAKLLIEMVKGKDVVARFGGEEFFIILPNTSIGAANKVAENIRESICRKELRNRVNGDVYGVINVSIGVALFRCESDVVETFIKRADAALYRSKKAGRNRVTQETLGEL